MMDALNVRSFSYQQRWGEAAALVTLAERSEKLTMDIRIEQEIADRLKTVQTCVSEQLDAIIADHLERGLVRTGATLKAGIGIFETRASGLIEGLVEAVAPLSDDPQAYQLIEDAAAQFFIFLDGELDRIIDKVDFELQDRTQSASFAQAARRLWEQERGCLLGNLEQHRAQFLGARLKAGASEAADTWEASVVANDEAENALELDTPAGDEAIVAEPDEGDGVGADAGASPDLPEARFDAEETDIMAINPAIRDLWAEIAVRLWTSGQRPKSRGELHAALSETFERHEMDPDGYSTKDMISLLWRKFLASQRVISSINRSVEDFARNPEAISFSPQRGGGFAWGEDGGPALSFGAGSGARDGAALAATAHDWLSLSAPSMDMD